MIKRILKFKADDWKHIWFLFKNMIVQFLKGDFLEAKDAWYWIRIHVEFDSKRVK